MSLNPTEIDFQINYRCPKCHWSNWVPKNLILNAKYKRVFCCCGHSFIINKPKYIHKDSEAKPDKPTEKAGSAYSDLFRLLENSGFSAIETKNIIKIAAERDITSLQEIFEKIVPNL